MPLPSHRQYLRTRRFAALDGLRAVTVLSLIAMHYGFGDLRDLVGKGKITIFFVLSGFVITLLLLRDTETHGNIRLRKFLVRRQFRLLPAYYAVLLLTIVCRYGIGDVSDADGSWPELWRQLPYYLTFSHEWGPGGTDIITYVHSWTLAYEQKFYLLWPLIFYALTRWAPRWRLAATAALGAACLALIPLAGSWWVQYFSLILGSALALVLHDERGFRRLRPLMHPAVAGVVALGFFALHIHIGRLVSHPHDPILAWYAVATAALIVSILHSGPAQWLLSRRLLGFIGERGYAMYLLHGLAGTAVLALTPTWQSGGYGRAVIICAVTLVFADALYRYVELPSAAAGRRFNAWLDTFSHNEKREADRMADLPRQSAVSRRVRASRQGST